MAEENGTPNTSNNPTPANGGNNNKNTGLVIAIIVLAVLLVVAVTLALVFALRDPDKKSKDDNPDPETVEPSPTEPDSETHVWGDGVEVVSPTCTETGLMEYTCTICGVKEDVIIPALGHDHEGGGILVDEFDNNGVRQGIIDFTCARCGEAAAEARDIYFESDTWEEISEYAASGEASSRYYVGETKTISITEYETITDDEGNETTEPVEETIQLRIIDFDHDDLSESDEGYDNPDYNNGTNKAAITVETVTLLNGTYVMNTEATNAGGWEDSVLRMRLQPKGDNEDERAGNIYNLFSEEFTPYVKTVDKKTNNGWDTDNPYEIVASEDKLFLLSVAEIYSEEAITNSVWNELKNSSSIYIQEGTQYEWYRQNIGDHEPNNYEGTHLLKYREGATEAGIWRLRSPYTGGWYSGCGWTGDNYEYHIIGQVGRLGYIGARADRALSFAFCI